MAIIDLPAPLPLRNAEWRLQSPAQVNRSTWTGRRKVIGLPGAQRWTMTADFASIQGAAKARPWIGWFFALHGTINAFRVPFADAPQTSASNPTVRTGAGSGNTLPLAGLPASATAMNAGHAMTVPLPSGHERLVVLTASLTTNSSGQGTATFWPELGEVPAAGATVEIGSPWALLALADDTIALTISERIKRGFKLAAEEAQ